MIEVDYLKKVGFRLEKDNQGSLSIVLKHNYRFPTLSCKLKQEGENENADGNLIFSLSYFISDDFSKQSLDFTFEDWYNWKKGNDCDSFSVAKTIKRNLGFDFFKYFSITETLLIKVYQSRLKGRKAWKKRNWALPFRNSSVRNAFGVGERTKSEKTSEDCSFTRSVDYVKSIEQIVELDRLMNLCVHKASQDFSYAPFDVYFDCYKKKLSLERKIRGTETKEIESSVSTRINRDKVFKEFAKQVVLLQKNG